MFIKRAWVKKQNPDSEEMQRISKSIKDAALAFLAAAYKLLLIFMSIASVALFGIG